MIRRLCPDAPPGVFDENVVEGGLADGQSDHVNNPSVSVQASQELRTGAARVANSQANTERLGCDRLQGAEPSEQASHVFLLPRQVLGSIGVELQGHCVCPDACLQVCRTSIDDDPSVV